MASGLAAGEQLHAGLDEGWVLPEPAARQAVQTRSMVFRSFRRDDGLIDIDARFADTRPFAYDNACFCPHSPTDAQPDSPVASTFGTGSATRWRSATV